MTRTRNRLTTKAIENRKAKGRMNDGQGLHLRITDTGAKGWIFRHTFPKGGKVREMGLGGYPAVSLADARAKADNCRKLIATGIDPKSERDQNTGLTFGDVADQFFQKERTRWTNDKAAYKWRRTLEETCAPIRSVPVAEISTDHVRRILDPIWMKTPYTAKQVRGRLEEVLYFAKAKGYRTGENPAIWRGHLQHIMPPHPKKAVRHHRAMPYSEVPGFLQELQARDALAARALEFLILTACRTIEVLNATWSEIDFDARLWTIPAERMKMREAHQVPLSDRAIAILRELHSVRHSNYIFPGQRSGRPLANTTLLMLLRRMKVTNAVSHGFRSTFRDWCGDETEFGREVAEAALAHKIGNKVEQAYRRGRALDKRRRLMAAWADYCAGTGAGKVVQLHG